jgi:hypothetical protein
VDTKLKTGIAEDLREPLMKIAQKLLISDKATFEQLTTTEQNLWTKFETGDIYRFLTGEEDTVPEFQYNCMSVPRLQPLEPTIITTRALAANAAPYAAPPVAPPQPPLAPASPPDSGSSMSTTSSMPHSSPTPSTLGTRPKQATPAPTRPKQPDPSETSTSGTTTTPSTTKTHKLIQ